MAPGFAGVPNFHDLAVAEAEHLYPTRLEFITIVASATPLPKSSDEFACTDQFCRNDLARLAFGQKRFQPLPRVRHAQGANFARFVAIGWIVDELWKQVEMSLAINLRKVSPDNALVFITHQFRGHFILQSPLLGVTGGDKCFAVRIWTPRRSPRILP